MSEMGIAADLARYKNISLAGASEILAKVNAGSLRPLTQLGIQLDIGSLKLTAQVKATEAVTKAKKDLKVAEEGMAAAVKKGSEEHAAAEAKVTAADEALKNAQQTLRSDSEGLASAQEGLKTAQNAVTEAAQKQKTAIKEAAAALKSAEEAARETAEQGAKGVEGAKKNLSNLEKERSKESNEAAIKTIEGEEKVLEATKTAASEGALVQLREKKATLEASDKGMEAQKKEQALQEAQKGISEAEASAHKNNKTAISGVAKAHDALHRAQLESLSSSKENVAAAHAVTQAQRGVSAAETKLTKDQDAAARASATLAQAQTAAAKSSAAVVAAQAKLTAAHEKVSEAEKTLQKDQTSTGKVMEALKQKIGGTATAFGQTLAGQTDIAKAKLNEVMVTIGQRLTPVLLALISVAKGLGAVLAPVWQAFVSGIQWVARAAANLDVAWESNWHGIRSTTETVTKTVASIITFEFKAVLATLTFLWKAVVFVFYGAWADIAKIVSDGVGKVVKFVTSLPGKIISALSGLVKYMKNLGAEMIQALVEGITSAPSAVVKAVEKLIPGGSAIGEVAKAIGLAKGGIVTKPTLAVVGEAGPEAIVPLSGGIATAPDGIQPLRPATATSAASGATGKGGLNIGSISLYGPQMSPGQMTQALYLELRPLLQGA